VLELIRSVFLLKNNDLFEMKIKNYIIENTAHRLPLLFPIFQVTVEYPVEKTLRPWRQSMNRSNFGNPHKMFIFPLINHEPLIETGGNPKGQYLENTAGGLRLPISMFPGMFSLVSPREVEHCRAVK
jgi:hypothetical protein